MCSENLPKSAEQNCSCGCPIKNAIASLSEACTIVIALKRKATRRICEFILYSSLDFNNSALVTFILSFGGCCSAYDT